MGDIVLTEIAKDLIINIINIIVLFFIVKLLVYKPVKKFLNERTANINSMNEQAKKSLDKAKEAESKRDEIIESGRKESEKLINDAGKLAKQNAEKIINNAKEDAEKILSKARKEIETEHNEMLNNAKEELTEMAVDISRLILKREVSAEDNKKTVDDFFALNGDKL